MLSIAYLEAYQKTKNEEYATVAREIFEYVSRDMTSSEGGFFSAEDADSEGEEGTFYIWSKEEVLEILGDQDGSKFSKIYGFEKKGNFYDESTGQSNGKNIPYLSRSITDLSKKYGIKEPELKKLLKTSRERLFEVRKKRIHPLKDDKILTDWNGLMIAAYALGGQILNDTSLINTAKNSFDFIDNNLTDKNGRLMKRYRLGDSGLSPHIDDYAFTTWGLLNLYDATFEIKYLSKAIKLTKVMIQEFSDQNGGFFIGGINSEKLMIRAKDSYDGAIPSGNSVAVNNLFRLSKLTGDLSLDSISKSTLRAFTDQAKQSPSGFSHMITGFMFNIKDPIQLVIVADSREHDLNKIFEKINLKYYPNKVILLKDISKPEELEGIAPWVKDYKIMDNKPTYYLCKDFVCKRPTTNLNTILKMIDKH